MPVYSRVDDLIALFGPDGIVFLGRINLLSSDDAYRPVGGNNNNSNNNDNPIDRAVIYAAGRTLKGDRPINIL